MYTSKRIKQILFNSLVFHGFASQNCPGFILKTTTR